MRRFLILAALAALTGGAQAQETRLEQLQRQVRESMERLMPSGPKTEVAPDRLLVKFSVVEANRLQTMASKRRGSSGTLQLRPGVTWTNRIASSGWTLWSVPAGTDPRALAAELKRTDPRVVAAQPAHRLYLMSPTPNDGDWWTIEDSPDLIIGDGAGTFRRLWTLQDLNAEAAWDIWPNTWFTAATKPADPPVIAIIDTGVDMNHPDYINAGGISTSHLLGGQMDFTTSMSFVLGVADPNLSPNDPYGHGTHVAGIAVAAGNNGALDGKGMIGTGFNSRAMVLRVFDEDAYGTDAEAAAAMYYAADNGADIINLSLGTESYSQIMQDAVTYAWQKGLVVVSAGNQRGTGGGPMPPMYPAAMSGALAVTANGPNQQKATAYPGDGGYIDVASPAGDVVVDFLNLTAVIQYTWSTSMTTPGVMNSMGLVPPYDLNYAYQVGTSMATPHVAGAMGLFFGKNGLDRSQGGANLRAFRALLRSTDRIYGPSNGGRNDLQGYGAVNLARFLQEGAESDTWTVGGVKGMLYDDSSPRASVLIEAEPLGGGNKITTTSLPDGTFRFQNLPPGLWRIVAGPRGSQPETKIARVVAGTDMNGFDFWIGGAGWDTTPPTHHPLTVTNITPTSVRLNHWGLDTETGIDAVETGIGTSQNGTNVQAFISQPIGDNPVDLTGLNLTPGQTYWATVRYRNGGNLTTTVSTQFTVPAPVSIAGTIGLDGFTVPNGLQLTLQLRTPGTTTVLETHPITLNASRQYTLNTSRTGLVDVAVDGPLWLRRVVRNVNLVAGPNTLNADLINGDCDGNNSIGIADFTLLSAAWRATSMSGNWDSRADLDGNGTVGLSDYLILTRNWRRTGDN